MKCSSIFFGSFLFLFLLPLNAHAYLGPGLGVGAIGAILGVIGSVILGIFAVLYYPIKRLLKRSGLIGKKGNIAEREENAGGQNQDSEGTE